MNQDIASKLRDNAYGHADIWECTLDEFIAKVLPVVQEHYKKHSDLTPKVIKLAMQFLRLHFDAKELKGTIEHEVSRAIDESLIYYVNCTGEGV